MNELPPILSRPLVDVDKDRAGELLHHARAAAEAFIFQTENGAEETVRQKRIGQVGLRRRGRRRQQKGRQKGHDRHQAGGDRTDHTGRTDHVGRTDRTTRTAVPCGALHTVGQRRACGGCDIQDADGSGSKVLAMSGAGQIKR